MGRRGGRDGQEVRMFCSLLPSPDPGSLLVICNTRAPNFFSNTISTCSLSGGSDQGLIVTSVDALIELEGNFRGGELRRPIGPAKELEIKRDREIEMEIKE